MTKFSTIANNMTGKFYVNKVYAASLDLPRVISVVSSSREVAREEQFVLAADIELVEGQWYEFTFDMLHTKIELYAIGIKIRSSKAVEGPSVDMTKVIPADLAKPKLLPRQPGSGSPIGLFRTYRSLRSSSSNLSGLNARNLSIAASAMRMF